MKFNVNNIYLASSHDIFVLIPVGVMQPVNSRQTPSAVQVVVTQPPPVPVLVTCLTNIPGLVRCPHCHQVGVTKVKHVPGSGAWCMCALIALMGWDAQTHTHRYLMPDSFDRASFTYILLVYVCAFQVHLWFLSDTVMDTWTTRFTSLLPTVWNPSAHLQKMTLPGLISSPVVIHPKALTVLSELLL